MLICFADRFIDSHWVRRVHLVQRNGRRMLARRNKQAAFRALYIYISVINSKQDMINRTLPDAFG